MIKNKKIEILMIGPGSSSVSSGGIVSLIDGIVESLGEDFKVTRVITMRPVGMIKRIFIYLNSIYLILKARLRVNKKIAHVHLASRGSFYRKSILIILLRILKIPLIIHIHGAEFHIFLSKESSMIMQKYIKWIFSLSSKTILLTYSWEIWYKESINKSESCVVYNGVRNYYSDTSIPITERKNVILFLGRLGKRKGIYDLLRAFKNVLVTIPNAQLKIGGDGEIKSCKELAAKLNILENVDFLGWVDEYEKTKLLNEAKIYILPSYNEGLPMGLLEAMSAEIGVISSAVGGIPEAIIDKENGLLITPGNINEITKSMLLLLSNDVLLLKISKNAKNIYLEKFDIQKIMKNFEREYNELNKKP